MEDEENGRSRPAIQPVEVDEIAVGEREPLTPESKPGAPDQGGILLVTGPASSAQIADADLLSVEAGSFAQLSDGARVELGGTFEVGTRPASRASLTVKGARPRESLLRATEPDVFTSIVGAPSDAPAAERLAPTGTLHLEGGRLELFGPDHDLVVVVRWIDRGHVEGFLRLVLESVAS